MVKKNALLVALAAVAAALAAPAVAGADIKLTENGKALAVNSEITTTDKGGKITFDFLGFESELSCALKTLHHKVLNNGPKHLELEVLGSTTSGCELTLVGLGSTPVVVTEEIEEEALPIITFDTWGKASLVKQITFHVPALGVSCSLEGEFEIQAEAEGREWEVAPAEVFSGSGGVFCPLVGSVHASGIRGETSDETLVTPDFVKTP